MRARAAGRRILPATVPFILAVVLFAPATLGGKVLSASDLALFEPPFAPDPGARPSVPLQFDAAFVFEPDGLVVRRVLRDLRLPVWTPLQHAGQPLLAMQQSAPLWPLTWLGVIAPFFPALAWIAVLKLTLAGLGTALLARALGLRTGPALLAALSFAFGTYLVDWLGHPHGNAYVLLPWLLLAAERLCRSGSVRDAGLLGVLTGLAWLSGQPESALLVTLPTAAFIVHRLLALRPPRRTAVQCGLLAAGAGLAGIALGAVMIVPLFEVLGQSAEDNRSRPPLDLSSVVTLVAPEYWGRPDGVTLGGPSNFFERTLYAGVLPLLLAVGALAVRRPRGLELYFLGLALVGVAVSWDTGPIALVAHNLPVLDRIGVTRALVLSSFAIALLAGFGLQRLIDGGAAERRRILTVASAAGAVPVVLLVVGRGSLGALPDGLRRLAGANAAPTEAAVADAAVLRWLLLAAASVTVVALLLRAGRRALAAGAACTVAALDLLLMGAGINPAIDRRRAEPAATPAIAAMRRLTVDGGRVMGFGGLEPNTGSRWGLADARGHAQPRLERPTGLHAALGQPTGPAQSHIPLFLDVFDVRAVLLPAHRPPPTVLRRLPVFHEGADGMVLANPSALPPAFVAYGWRRARDFSGSVRLLVAGGSRGARDEPVIETADAPPAGDVRPAMPARILTRTDTRVVVDARARGSGRLVLLDTFYPGWRAEVDGRSVPIEVANGAFRAVPLGPGRHRVEFSYRPASVLAGGVVSVIALLALVACIAWPRRGELHPHSHEAPIV